MFFKDGWSVTTIAEPEHRWIIPLAVTGPESFTLIAVWSWVEVSNFEGYVNPIREALASHPEWFERGEVVIAGDFNSNCQWDVLTRGGHTSLVAELADRGLASTYHAHHNEAHGSETRPTFHMGRRPKEPFHIDYVFAPDAWISRVSHCEVGVPAIWLQHSDHCPITVDFAR